MGHELAATTQETAKIVPLVVLWYDSDFSGAERKERTSVSK